MALGSAACAVGLTPCLLFKIISPHLGALEFGRPGTSTDPQFCFCIAPNLSEPQFPVSKLMILPPVPGVVVRIRDQIGKVPRTAPGMVDTIAIIIIVITLM